MAFWKALRFSINLKLGPEVWIFVTDPGWSLLINLQQETVSHYPVPHRTIRNSGPYLHKTEPSLRTSSKAPDGSFSSIISSIHWRIWPSSSSSRFPESWLQELLKSFKFFLAKHWSNLISLGVPRLIERVTTDLTQMFISLCWLEKPLI